MSPEACSTWSLIFQGLTAVGTVGAVIVALFLSRRQEQPRIQVTAGIKYLAGNQLAEAQEGVCIQAKISESEMSELLYMDTR